jgi:hypothetical protein
MGRLIETALVLGVIWVGAMFAVPMIFMGLAAHRAHDLHEKSRAIGDTAVFMKAIGRDAVFVIGVAGAVISLLFTVPPYLEARAKCEELERGMVFEQLDIFGDLDIDIERPNSEAYAENKCANLPFT